MLEEAGRVVFGFMCHQDSSLLLAIDGRLLLLCPRCAGLHLGFLTTFTMTTIWFGSTSGLARRGVRVVLVAAVASLLLDWGIGGQMGLFTPSIQSRLLTGLACGSALAIVLAAYRRSLGTPTPVATADLTLAQTFCVMSASAGLGVVAVSQSSWAFLTLLCLVSVGANAALLVDTVVRMWRSRLGQPVANRSPSYSRGGAA